MCHIVVLPATGNHRNDICVLEHRQEVLYFKRFGVCVLYLKERWIRYILMCASVCVWKHFSWYPNSKHTLTVRARNLSVNGDYVAIRLPKKQVQGIVT